MAVQTHCTGTLIWFDVPADPPRFGPSALLLCSDCGYLIVSGSVLDDRHHEAPVIRGS